MSFAALVTQVVGGFLAETVPTACLDPKIKATLYYSDQQDTQTHDDHGAGTDTFAGLLPKGQLNYFGGSSSNKNRC